LILLAKASDKNWLLIWGGGFMGKLVDLDRELIRELKSGGTQVWEKLFLCNQNFIRRCANKTCSRYFCIRLKEDLIAVGDLAFFEHAKDYDPDNDASLTTYLYPYIMGDMRREVERSFSCMEIAKRDFQLMRKIKAMYDGKAGIPEIAKENGLEESEAGQLIMQTIALFSNKGTIYLGTTRLLVVRDLPVHRQVFLKICLELLKEAFNNELSFKEKEILGGYFGVYGYEKKRLSDIGEPFNMKSDAVLKAKDSILKKFAKLCMKGDLGSWRKVYAMVAMCGR
jgi:DNA-directed RNA polymerase specialized sigma subunit